MFNNSNHCLHPLLPLSSFCVCNCMLLCSALCQWAMVLQHSQSLSAFGCSEGNQLWQSCKLFLWRAKEARAHTHSPSAIPLSGPSQFLWAPYPSGLKGPSQAISVTWATKRGPLVCTERERRWTEGERERGRGWKETLLGISEPLFAK